MKEGPGYSNMPPKRDNPNLRNKQGGGQACLTVAQIRERIGVLERELDTARYALLIREAAELRP
jgi:hypothetical protein